MKKKLLSIIIICILAVSVVACGGSEEPKEEKESTEATAPSQTEEQEEAEAQTGTVEKINLDNSEGTLIYTKHEVTSDFEGKPAVLVYFDYTNKKDESSFAQMTFYPQVFQNGVECEMGITTAENESVSNASKEIQKDTTINVAYIFVLQDNTNPVTLKVSDQSAENLLSDISQEQELALQ